MAKRFFDDDPLPGPGLAVETAPRLAFGDDASGTDVDDDRFIELRGQREIEDDVFAGVVCLGDRTHPLLEPLVRIDLGRVAGVIVDQG